MQVAKRETDKSVLPANDAAKMLRMLANQKRLLILCALARHEEIGVSELAHEIDLGMSSLSQHLAKLRADGLVEARKEGHQVFYRIGSHNAARILDVLKNMTMMPSPEKRNVKKGKLGHGDRQHNG